MNWTHRALTALLVFVSVPAFAQATLHSDDFERGGGGWQLHGMWNVDGTPGNVPGGSASFRASEWLLTLPGDSR